MKHDVNDPQQTDDFARAIGRRLKGGEVIELTSDLGGGKTTFVRGLAAGMGSPDHVASPTFTISREYRSDRLTLHHYDFYRLAENAGVMADELREVLSDPQAVTVVEWSGAVTHVLPDARLRIGITRTGDTSRCFTLEVPDELKYLTEDK